jgi:hypothetical protein
MIRSNDELTLKFEISDAMRDKLMRKPQSSTVLHDGSLEGLVFLGREKKGNASLLKAEVEVAGDKERVVEEYAVGEEGGDDCDWETSDIQIDLLLGDSKSAGGVPPSPSKESREEILELESGEISPYVDEEDDYELLCDIAHPMVILNVTKYLSLMNLSHHIEDYQGIVDELLERFLLNNPQTSELLFATGCAMHTTEMRFKEDVDLFLQNGEIVDVLVYPKQINGEALDDLWDRIIRPAPGDFEVVNYIKDFLRECYRDIAWKSAMAVELEDLGRREGERSLRRIAHDITDVSKVMNRVKALKETSFDSVVGNPLEEALARKSSRDALEGGNSNLLTNIVAMIFQRLPRER